MASPSARPDAAHKVSDSGLPGYDLCNPPCTPGSVVPAPGQNVAFEGNITARSCPFGMRRVSRPSTELPQPRCEVHALRASGCRAIATAHAKGACDARRGNSVGARPLWVSISPFSPLELNRARSAFRSSTANGADRASSANAVISSGITTSSSPCSSATHSNATPRSYASTRPGGCPEEDVVNGEPAAAAPARDEPAAASSGSAPPFAAARIIVGIKHPAIKYLLVSGDARRAPTKRIAAAAKRVSSSNRNNLFGGWTLL
mmetsp:Transcript_1015/g.3872  ORF Transcript_1015/g.3872 Transcript_1015/m.3872 type:complete len:261 (+) Transcript_1015:3513-4295(+)